MKHLILLASIFTFMACSFENKGGTFSPDYNAICPESSRGFFTDLRDGREYKYTTIGNQVWMAENLNYKTANSYCYKDNADNCTIYGRLYPIRDVYNLRDFTSPGCPQGWHLPTQAEWEELTETLGGKEFVTTGILQTTDGWYRNTVYYPNENLESYNRGTDICGFAALPAGSVPSINQYSPYRYLGTHAEWLSATQKTDYNMVTYQEGYYSYAYPTALYSVRCVQD